LSDLIDELSDCSVMCARLCEMAESDCLMDVNDRGTLSVVDCYRWEKQVETGAGVIAQ